MAKTAAAIRVSALLLGLAGAAQAEEEALPDLASCMDTEIARFERELRAFEGAGHAGRMFDIARTDGVEYCGTLGIVRCDRSDDPLACQRALAGQQDALREAVLSGLRLPPALSGDEAFAVQLYRRVWALSQGRSAGPDCAGATPRFAHWCEAREANSRLRNAVLAWQLARYLGLSAPAIEAGWARPPSPVRPQPRPGSEQ